MGGETVDLAATAIGRIAQVPAGTAPSAQTITFPAIPDQVLGVRRLGVRESARPGWKGILDDADVRAAAAYINYLGHRPVPDALRRP